MLRPLFLALSSPSSVALTLRAMNRKKKTWNIISLRDFLVACSAVGVIGDVRGDVSGGVGGGVRDGVRGGVR